MRTAQGGSRGCRVYRSDLQKEGLNNGVHRIVRCGSRDPVWVTGRMLKQRQEHRKGVSCVRVVRYCGERRGVWFWVFGYFTVKPLGENAFKAIGETGLKFG